MYVWFVSIVLSLTAAADDDMNEVLMSVRKKKNKVVGKMTVEMTERPTKQPSNGFSEFEQSINNVNGIRIENY